MPGINLKLADEFAPDYDNSVLKNNWNGPEFLFRAIRERINPKSKILDLGIGTGESSIRFIKAGHKITGLDGSENMLKYCKRKMEAANLVCHNLENPPFPFTPNLFDAVVSNGVFHLVYPLFPVFSEVKRILISGGYFAFTFADALTKDGFESKEPGIWEKITESGVSTFKYSDEYILNLLHQNRFHILQRERFRAFTNPQNAEDFYFTLLLAQLY